MTMTITTINAAPAMTTEIDASTAAVVTLVERGLGSGVLDVSCVGLGLKDSVGVTSTALVLDGGVDWIVLVIDIVE